MATATVNVQDSMGLSLSLLSEWAQKNRHRAATLKRTPQMLLQGSDDYIMDTYKFPSKAGPWTSETLEPAGILSFLVYLRNPMYRAADRQLRKQLYLEALMEFQLELEKKITGTRFARRKRKIIEVLCSHTPSKCDPEDIVLHEECWASLLGYQFVKVSSRAETGKRISFVPAALNTWDAEKPVYFVDEGFETLFLAPEPGLEKRTLATYLSAVEDAGWNISWPQADGSKEDLEARIIPLLGMVKVSEKAKKAELATIIGRHEGLQVLIQMADAD